MICLNDTCQYWVQLDCGHELCAECYVNISACPLKCTDNIDESKVKLIVNS